MSETFLEKEKQLLSLFEGCHTDQKKFEKLIDLGKQQSRLSPEHRIQENRVSGCQSTMYLHSQLENGRMQFAVDSDALISAGLAALLVIVYNDESPETVLKTQPAFIETLGLRNSLTPSRANGLYSIHLKMRQDALKFLVEQGREKTDA